VRRLLGAIRCLVSTRTGIIVSSLLLIMALIVMPSVAVTWSDYEIRLTTYRDFDGLPSVMETKEGRVWVFWSRNMGGGNYSIFYMTSSDRGVTWSQEIPLVVNSHVNTGVSAFQAKNGTVWVVWASDRTGDYEIFYKVSHNGGASWSEEVRLTTNSSKDMSPTICETVEGTVWVVWSSDRSGGYDLYYKIFSEGGASWSNDTRLTTDPDLDKLPSISRMKDGSVWVVWSSDRTGDFEIFYQTYKGSVWSSETRLTVDTNVDLDPAVLQTLDGRIWVFWASRQPVQLAQDDLYYKYSSDNGVTWSDSFRLTTDNNDDVWPSAVQGYDSRIWVVWTSDRSDQPDGNWDIYYRTSLAGDVNEDGIVDIFDLSYVSMHYGCFSWEPCYDLVADINRDGVVDMRDLTIVGMNFGAT